MCGDGGRVVIHLHTDPENQGTGASQLLTPYTHGVPHVDCQAEWYCCTRMWLLMCFKHAINWNASGRAAEQGL